MRPDQALSAWKMVDLVRTLEGLHDTAKSTEEDLEKLKEEEKGSSYHEARLNAYTDAKAHLRGFRQAIGMILDAGKDEPDLALQIELFAGVRDR